MMPVPALPLRGGGLARFLVQANDFLVVFAYRSDKYAGVLTLQRRSVRNRRVLMTAFTGILARRRPAKEGQGQASSAHRNLLNRKVMC